MRVMMLLYSSSSPTIIYALVAASGGLLRLVTAAEITTEQLYGTLTSTNAALPPFNVEGGSVVTTLPTLTTLGSSSGITGKLL